jgi:hypothetical protein
MDQLGKYAYKQSNNIWVTDHQKRPTKKKYYLKSVQILYKLFEFGNVQTEKNHGRIAIPFHVVHVYESVRKLNLTG